MYLQIPAILHQSNFENTRLKLLKLISFESFVFCDIEYLKYLNQDGYISVESV